MKSKDSVKKILNLTSSGQGGVEVFAERFKRYMDDEFEVENISDKDRDFKNFFSLFRKLKEADFIIVNRGYLMKHTFLPWILSGFHTRPKLIFHQQVTMEGKKRDPYHKFIYSKASSFVAISKKIRELIIEKWGVSPEKVRTIYHGVPCDIFSPVPHMRDQVRNEMGISQEEFVAGVVARIERGKGQGIILDAIKEAGLEKRIRVVFVGPVGDHLYLGELLRKSMGMSVTFLTGFRKDIHLIYNAFDVLVITSKWEAFGLVGLEALACGIPVVAPDNAGISEVLSDGNDSIIYKANDAQSLAEKLRLVCQMKDNLREMGMCGREKVMKEFCMERFLEDWKKLLRSIL